MPHHPARPIHRQEIPYPRPAAAAIAAIAAALVAGPATAQLPMPASTQFDVTGFIQEATLGPGLTGLGVGLGAGAHQGGTIKVNGQVIIVPSETVVIFPANALTWQEVFAQAPAPYTGLATGMALADLPAPLTTYEAHVIGNRVRADASHPTDSYIAGLIYVSQHALNGGAGFINFIDYALGELRVGGKVTLDAAGNPVNALDPASPGARVRLNDPVGRFGRAMTPDRRFSVDDANPTIIAGTGFPMCLPRSDPAGAAPDALCPQSQRQPAVAPATGFATTIQMNDPRPACTNPPTNTLPAGCSPTGVGPATAPSALVQVPFEVGDYVTYAGTLVTDAATPTAGPFPANGAAGTYVSAHTITNNIAVYTWPGTDPAYVMTEVALIGTGGLTVVGAGEAVIRTRFEGMTTDPSRGIHLYGVDLTPVTGATTDRDFGTIGVDPGPPTGAVKGRWRFRPPCLAFGTVPSKPDKQCVMNAAGTFLPPPREVRAVIEGQQGQNPANPGALTAANGIFYGQYHAPIGEYIFPENIPGSPIVENNFNTLDFLALGGYASSAGTIAGVLDPWPSNALPTAACTPPVASAGGPYAVAFNGTVVLNGSATGTAPTLTWAAPAAGTLAPLTGAAPTYSAVGAAAGQVVPLTLTASNACGSSSASSSVAVATPTAPTVNPVAAVSLFSGAAGSLTLTGSDPNVPALVPLVYTVTQAPAGTLLNLAVAQPVAATPTTGTATFTAPTLPLGQVAPTVVTLTITAANAAGAVSTSVTTTVTVKPLPDAVVITAAQYRTGKQRLTVNASSSVVSPNVVLTLAPYACNAVQPPGVPPCPGGTFNPATLGNTFTNNGGGLYILTLVGAPEPTVPSALVATSNLGGASPPFTAMTVRQ